MGKNKVVSSVVTQKVKSYTEVDLNEVATGDQELVSIPVGMLHLLLEGFDELKEDIQLDFNELAKDIDECR